MPDEYPSNSLNPASQRPPQRQRQKAVVTGVQVRKKPLSNRISERSVQIFKDVLYETIGPYFRDMFADSGYAVIDRIFYHDGAGRSASGRPRPGKPQQQTTAAGYVITDYSSQYQGQTQSTAYEPGRTKFDFTIFTFPDYAAGRELIDRLTHIVSGYGHATVNDLYDLFGKQGDHPGENYGWDDLNDIAAAEIRRVRGGGAYYLDIPDAKPIKK